MIGDQLADVGRQAREDDLTVLCLFRGKSSTLTFALAALFAPFASICARPVPRDFSLGAQGWPAHGEDMKRD